MEHIHSFWEDLVSTSPFVGRARELGSLHNALLRALEGHPSLVFLAGEAGIGKSRLVREFVQQSRTMFPSLIVATGECNSHYGQADPLLPFRTISAQLFGEDRGKLSQADQQSLATKAKEVILEIAPDAIGIFIPLVGLGLKLLQALSKLNRSKRELSQGDKIARVALFEQFSRLLFWATQEAPLLLILEDLHWADATTVDFLFYLARSWKNEHLLVVGTYRPQDLTADEREHPLLQIIRDLTRYGLCQQIELDWLSEQELQEWLVKQYPTNRFKSDFARWLHERTEGNALFVDEIIKQLEDTDAIFLADDGVWELSKSLTGTTDLPSSIVAVLEQRLARLESRLRDALTCASVEGEEFTAQVIAAVRHLEEDNVVHELENVLERRMKLIALKEERRLTQRRWLTVFEFRHTLMQRHLYGTLSASSRRRLHQCVGECLEQLYGEEVDQIAPVLARHFIECKDDARAYRYAGVAAQHAERVFDYQAARLWLEVTIARLSAAELDLPGQAKLWHRLGRAQFWTGDFPRAEFSYRKALECCVSCDDKTTSAQVLTDLAHMYSNMDRSHAAIALLQEAVDLCERFGLQKEAAYAMLRLAIAYQKLARHDLHYEYLIRAKQEFEAMDDLAGLAEVSRSLGIYYKIVNDRDRSIAHLMQAIELHHQLGDKYGEAADYTNLGSTCLALENDDEQALACYQRSLDLSYEGAAMHEQAHVLLNMGRVYGLREQWEQALHHIENGIRLSELVQEKYNIIRGLWYLGIVHFHMGNIPAGIADYQKAIDTMISDPWLHWPVLYNFGSIQMEEGESERGIALYFEACNLLLNIAAAMPDRERATFIQIQDKVNVFRALVFWGKRFGHVNLTDSVIERLPYTVCLDLEQPPPRFYWGGGRWV